MKKSMIIIICLVTLALGGCKEEQQKPESEGVSGGEVMEVLSTHTTSDKKDISMTIHHTVKGQDIYLECIITPNFEFKESRETKKQGEGQVVVYLDNKKWGNFAKGAFILKDVPRGKHNLTVKLLHNDLTEYGIEQTIQVEI
ncbi:hypothetical protein ACQCU1_05870 [Sutcliffiella horikoshii]|uniref:Lipoprotein n=1 Tax=Sutcliffiella horikoshii TaxID=79883 RepID=A0ABM6KIK1_9BACI|nr:hypothetical protein [Sutcliffiella horikoshii]ART76227.1 hypothetical protein B4U37_09315 [Sutcliffiella horikoshii]